MSLCVLVLTMQDGYGVSGAPHSRLELVEISMRCYPQGVIKTQAETSNCPWCGNTIPQVKFIEIEGRIRAEEKKKLAQVESNLRQQYEEQTKLQVQQETKKAAEK